MGRFFTAPGPSGAAAADLAQKVSQLALVETRGNLPLHLNVDYLKQHLQVQDKQIRRTFDGHFIFFGEQRSSEWFDARRRGVWTGSRPSSGFFPRYQHWQTFARLHCAFPGKERIYKELWSKTFGSGERVSLLDNSVLTSAYAVFKVQDEPDSFTRQQNMAHGTKTEDIALRQFVQKYFPETGVVVEEFLHMAPYNPLDKNDKRMQGGSPDGLFLMQQADGSFEKRVVEVKCAAGCQDKDCKARRTKLAKQLREDNGGLHYQYCRLAAKTNQQNSPPAPLEAIRARMYAYLECKIHGFGFARTDVVTTRIADLQTATDLELIYCTNPWHKPAHKCLKTYYVPQMMGEMFHDGVLEGMYVAHGTEQPGGVVNAFGMNFDPKVWAATALFMETQREFAAYCATMFKPKPPTEDGGAGTVWNYKTGEWCSPQDEANASAYDESRALRDLYRSPQYMALYVRLHQCREFMTRLSERASLGASLYPPDDQDFWHKVDAYGAFWREWTELDDTSRQILAQAWVIPPASTRLARMPRELSVAERVAGADPSNPPPFLDRLPPPTPIESIESIDRDALHACIREAWGDTQREAFYQAYPQMRNFSFLHPPEECYAPLTLAALKTKYDEDYVAEHQRRTQAEAARHSAGAAGAWVDTPAPLEAVAPLLAPQGFVTEVMLFQDNVPRFYIPNDKEGKPNPKKARFQFVGLPSAADAGGEAKASETPLRLDDLFPRKQGFQKREFWCAAFNGYKQAPPLRIGLYDPDDLDRVWHNFDGACNAQLAQQGIKSPEKIPAGLPCRFVVQSVSNFYKPIAYISAILLPGRVE